MQRVAEAASESLRGPSIHFNPRATWGCSTKGGSSSAGATSKCWSRLSSLRAPLAPLLIPSCDTTCHACAPCWLHQGPVSGPQPPPVFSKAAVGARWSVHQHSPGESETAQTTPSQHCSRAMFTVLPSNLEHPWTPWDPLVILILFSRDAHGPGIKSTLNRNDSDSPTKRLGL